jgi:hypothetical protein
MNLQGDSMKDRILMALALVMTVGPAFAGTPPIRVPEPATITIFGAAVAGAYVLRKFMKSRK